MTRRVYKVIDGEFVQTEGPLWEGPQVSGETNCEICAPQRDRLQGYRCKRHEINAPAVVIPEKHRSAG